MKRNKNMISRTKLTSLLALLVLTLALSMVAPIALADVGKDTTDIFNEAIDSMFKEDGGIVSLTDFKGGLQAPSKEGLDASLTQVTSAREFVVKVVNYLLSFLGLAAVIITIYGGIRIVTSVGESDGVEKGRKAITYALIGIVVIMAAYAIVNFALKAPGGAPAGSPAQTAPPSASAGAEKGNTQSARTYNLLQSTIVSYSNYAQSRLAIENVTQEIDQLWNGTALSKPADATDALSKIESNYNQIAGTLESAAAKSASFSTASDMVQYQRLYVKQWEQEREQEIDLLKKTPATTGDIKFKNISDGLIDTSGLHKDETPINSKNGEFLAYNCSNDTYVSVPSDAECVNGRFNKNEYGAHFAKKYGQLTAALRDGKYAIEKTEVSIGVNEMKRQLAEDFDGQMDVNAKELKGIRQALLRTDGTLIIGEAGRKLLDDSSGDFIELKQSKSNPIEGKKTLKSLAANLGALYELLRNLQGVEVKLSASVKEGSAPLIVTFKTQGSRDPSNLSIIDENIFWDLDGDGNFGITGKERNSLDCIEPKTATATCMYKKTGTYRVAVKIKSSATDKGIIEGVQYLDIKVNQPRARFNIELTTNSTAATAQKVIPIIAYDKNGLKKIDRSHIQLAYSDIEKGLKFSAVGTVAGSIEDASTATQSELTKITSDTIQRVHWNFGDGSEVDDSPSENPNILTIDHVYARKGTYQVILEVTGKDGVTDRKIFNVVVADISAIISVKPAFTVKVNSPITFSSTVTSDGSRVIVTEWSATPDLEKLRSKDPQFSAAIDKPGTYTVTLRVENENKATALDKVEVLVESNPPVARFTAKQASSLSPARIRLDASQTYDPDGENKDILYEWKIAGELDKDFRFIEGKETDKMVLIEFLKTGDHKITLSVEDANEKGKKSVSEETVTVKTLLSLAWSAKSQTTALLDGNGEAEVTLGIVAQNAANYSIDFGDGEVEDGALDPGELTVKHIYKKSGIYSVNASASDEENNTIKISRRIAVGDGRSPVVSGSILKNGETVDVSQTIEVTRKDAITFDASASRNIDGTTENLNVVWDFGDGKKSTKAVSTYSYKFLSPKEPGYFTAKLTVSDKSDPTKKSEDTFRFRVVSLKPELKTLLVVPLSANLKTPLRAELSAVGAKAPEGRIVSYRWWYYDAKDNSNELGGQITSTPKTTMNVGTKGEEGEEVTYMFNVELRDSENQVMTAGEIFGEGSLPSLTVINGANKPPVAKITVNKTSVLAGEAITFESASFDPDGKIISYAWDLDGDGFQNDTPSEKSSVSKVYKLAAQNGIKTRLKVVDDSYAESVSDPLTIYVTSQTTPPKPSFTVTQKPETLELTFKNTTILDPRVRLSEIVWDFDTNSIYATSDADNDGIKDNDREATKENPTYIYKSPGTYYVKLMVRDTAGVESTSRIPVQVNPLTTKSTHTPDFSVQPSALSAKLITTPAPYSEDGKIHLTGTSGNITLNYGQSVGPITRYVIDKNIYFDSNGDGIADNDENYKTATPGQWITDFQKSWGKIGVKLTVYDDAGKSSSRIVEVVFDTQLKSGANNMFAVGGAFELVGGLAGMFGFGILGYRSRRNKNRQT